MSFLSSSPPSPNIRANVNTSACIHAVPVVVTTFTRLCNTMNNRSVVKDAQSLPSSQVDLLPTEFSTYCHERKMARFHALIHCTNAKLRAARAEAWEGKDPGSIRVLLNNPRWGRRLLRFLELSGVGRAVGGEDVEETRTARPDGWIAWEAEERVAR